MHAQPPRSILARFRYTAKVRSCLRLSRRITSSGRGTPWLRSYMPQALQLFSPRGLMRQRAVTLVPQLAHTGGEVAVGWLE